VGEHPPIARGDHDRHTHEAAQETHRQDDGNPGGAWLLAGWPVRDSRWVECRQRRPLRVGGSDAPTLGTGGRPEEGVHLVVRDGSGGLGEAWALVSGPTVPEQRCIVHTRQNGRKNVRSERKGKENQEGQRTHPIEQAAAISRAETATHARLRVVHWTQHWYEHAPQSVATGARDGAQTLVLYEIAGLDVTWIRTTSMVERTHRK
jgi:hypothetical protein